MLGLCRYCLDEPPALAAGERCAHPECPLDVDAHGKVTGAPRLGARTPTRPSLVGGPGAEVVAPEEVRPAPHIGTQPSLSGRAR